jgi:methylase of polypeptide subunit release factors
MMEQLKQRKTKTVTEFGDFQTPGELALSATQLLRVLGIRARSIIEPTCGRGAFLRAAVACFPEAESVIGVDINESHLNEAAASARRADRRVELRQGDFFKVNWKSIVTKAGGPWLIIGNPPWVTSAGLGAIESDNLPEKSNFHGRMGIEAITGKSNFDISEWMLLRYLDWLEGNEGTIAVLCKTTVARKILLHIWKKKNPLHAARLYKIDALGHFGAAVDACFFVLEIKAWGNALSCDIFNSLDAPAPSQTIGFLDGHIISHVAAFNRHRSLLGPEDRYVWRSGVKHDCSKVMELMKTPVGYQNGLGETVTIEDTFLFPLLKSSDIGNGRIHCRAAMVVTQKAVGEDTSQIGEKAPKTWRYLKRHAALLGKRGSVIYKNKPEFSIFGVGPYSFAPWKIAISGFYKRLQFVKIGPAGGKPVVFDDTVNFVPCWSEGEADFIESLLRSEPAQAFFNSMIHWDEKRPVTVEILKRLSIEKLAVALGREEDYDRFTGYENLPLFAAR